MKIYAIQVRTGSEEAFVKYMNNKNNFGLYKFHCPKRELKERKQGKLIAVSKPVFSSYVFLETNKLTHYDYFNQPYTIRFLPSNENIKPLVNKDLEIIKYFLNSKGVLKVKYDENDRIVILEGALKGYEGQIEKVDRRKGRAKIRLDLYDDSFTIDLAFEVMGAA